MAKEKRDQVLDMTLGALGCLFAVVLTPLVLIALLVGIGVGTSKLLTYLYYGKRPILTAMRSAPGLHSWVDDSQPAKEAFFRIVPLGSNASDVTAALTGEGFECRSYRGTGCWIEVREFPETWRWVVRLIFEDDHRLKDVRIGLRTLSF